MTGGGGQGCGGGSAAAVATRGGGCGCGGSCGCGGTCGCEVSLAGEGFVRPRFFGGMLLCEDDLQAEVEYAAAKRRLTNRYVLGAGVVCGLEVTCDPCDPRKVAVSPGYAIECCGNDILVSCPERLDVIDLVRDLRKRLGKDCGEPCEEQPHEDYFLYVRYAEVPTEPVAPYAQDDCATGDCEFSRVREGYCFELRCDRPAREPILPEVLAACVPEDDKFRQDRAVIDDLMRATAARDRVSTRLAAGAEEVPRPPTKAEFDRLKGDDVALDDGLELVKRSLQVLAFDAAAAQGSAPSPGISDERRDLIARRTEELATRLRDAEALTDRPPIEVERIHRLLDMAVAPPNLAALGAPGRAWLAEGTTAEDAERAFVRGAQQIRRSVLASYQKRGQTTCDDYRRINGLRLDALSEMSSGEVKVLAGALERTSAECACAALNPPCPTCTDDAVLLAKLHVEDCEVKTVCALERSWVLSPRALAYWFPVVEVFRRAAEPVCCGEAVPSDRRTPIDVTGEALQRALELLGRALSMSRRV